MAFAQYLDDAQTPEWKKAYLDYRYLREEVRIVREAQRPGDAGLSDDADSENECERPQTPRSVVSSRFHESGFGARDPVRRMGARTSVAVSYVKSLRPRTRDTNRFSIISQRFALDELYVRLTSKERTFLAKLDDQLEKVVKFYTKQAKDLHIRARTLKEQLSELNDHKKYLDAVSSTPRSWTSAFMSGVGMNVIKRPALARSRRTVVSISREKKMPPHKLELEHDFAASVKAKLKREEDGLGLYNRKSASKRTFSLDWDEYFEARKTLKKAVLDNYRNLEMLYNYRVLNLMGFRKILKKFEDVTGIPILNAYMTERIDKSVLASGQDTRDLIFELEKQYSFSFTENNRKRARERLKGGPSHRSHHQSTFRSGAFLGMTVPLLTAGLWSSLQNLHFRHPRIPNWDALLYIYAILGIPVVLSLLIGLNLIVWSHARINYSFIFELEPRTRLDYREYFELPSIFLLTLCFCLWLSFYEVWSSAISPTHWPLIWLAFCCFMLFNPLQVFSRSSRYWLLRSSGRLLLAGLRPVGFTDFWLADIFCSLGFTLSGIYPIVCIYHSNFSKNLSQCTVSGSFWALGFFLQALPQLVRMIQTVKRYIDLGVSTHLVNGGKYGMSIIAIMVLYLWRHHGATNEGWLFALMCLTNTLHSSYASFLDLYLDWSIFGGRGKERRGQGWGRFLRSELLYPEAIPAYYFAIVSNVIVRFSWVVYTIPLQKGWPDTNARSLIIALLEMLRRWQWNFYRLENEHLGNMDQYRVTQELPLPYASSPVSEEEEADAREIRGLRRMSRRYSHQVSPLPLKIDVEDGLSDVLDIRRWSLNKDFEE